MAIKRPMTDMDKPRPKKMYLSGAITGRDREAVERKFAQAEIEMLAEGYIPISPLRNGLPEEATYEQHMERDLQMLCGCDAILMLPDWRDSPGARRELNEAIRWNKDVYFFNPLTINNMETKETKKYLQTEYDDIIYNPANVIYGAIHRNALGKGCVSPIYKIFYTDQDSTFMECIVRHPNFIKEISRSMEGTVKKLRTLKPKAFLEMSAYIAPTIEEQRQIGEYFRQMDRLIEIEKEELEKIKHIKSACLEKMFV